MDNGDIIRITDVQTLDGYTREILNVYYYKVISLTAPVELPVYASDLGQAFSGHVLAPVRAIQSSALKHVRLEFFNMSFQQEEAEYVYPVPQAGGNAGDYTPGNLTYSFRLQRYSRLTRHGRKSLAGVPDNAIDSGRLLNAYFVSTVSAVSTALGTPIFVEGDVTDATLNPVIVRVPSNPGVTPTVVNPVVGAVFRGFGTMNTRKEL